MKKALILHPSISTFGGAENVLVATLEVLKRLGYEVDVYSTGNPNIELLHKMISLGVNIKESFRAIPAFISIQSLLNILVHSSLRTKVYDMIIDTGCLYVPYTRCDIGYVHFPMYYPHLLLNSSIKSRTYGNALNVLSRFTYKMLPPYVRLLIFNSFFTKNVTLKLVIENQILYDSISSARKEVLYPPVNSKSISNVARKTLHNQKENNIVVCSRIEPFKRLEVAVQIMKEVVAMKRNAKLFIIGRISSKRYYLELLQLIRRYNLTNNIYIMPNSSYRMLLDTMLKSKVFLHVARNEHFGIAIVESMAAGLVPVVHDSGGPREYVEKKYRFNDNHEAAEKIVTILDKWSPKIAQYMMQKSWLFDISFFSGRLAELLESL
jgi:glycosyltransferase involved in cell wall biosynthesis